MTLKDFGGAGWVFWLNRLRIRDQDSNAKDLKGPAMKAPEAVRAYPLRLVSSLKSTQVPLIGWQD